MPATLVHMGVQGALLRFSKLGVDVLWIYVGAIIPDVGWILQRILRRLPLEIDTFSILSYAAALTSLLGCLIACAAIASLTTRYKRVFLLLAAGCLIHLLLDAAEVKWANGVLLMAPFSWKQTSWDIFQQDGAAILAATIGSLIFIGWTWRAGIREINRSMWRLSPRSLSVATGFSLLFFLWPIPVMDAPAKHGLYYIDSIRNVSDRTGKPVELDRARYDHQQHEIRIFTGETIAVTNFSAPRDTLVSLRGTFQSPQLLDVDDAIIHHPWQRAAAVRAGLGLFLLFIMQGTWTLIRSGRSQVI
jgi:hypothetical protein